MCDSLAEGVQHSEGCLEGHVIRPIQLSSKSLDLGWHLLSQSSVFALLISFISRFSAPRPVVTSCLRLLFQPMKTKVQLNLPPIGGFIICRPGQISDWTTNFSQLTFLRCGEMPKTNSVKPPSLSLWRFPDQLRLRPYHWSEPGLLERNSAFSRELAPNPMNAPIRQWELKTNVNSVICTLNIPLYWTEGLRSDPR